MGMRIDKKVAAPVATFVVIGALVVGVALLGSGGHRRPAALRLADSGPRDSTAALAPLAAQGDFVLVGELPPGTPADAPVWTVRSAATQATVARLARALGAGTPTRSAEGWRAGSLYVPDGAGQWFFSACSTVSSDGAVAKDLAGCAVSGSGIASAPGAVSGGSAGTTSTVAPAPPTPARGPVSSPAPTPGPYPTFSPPPVATADTVRRSAGPVLAALGLDPTAAVVAHGQAVVAPEVGGLPTVGLETRVSVSPDGTITDASGWLVDTLRGDSYPLLTARQAFDALPPMPRPMLACPVGPDGKGCLAPQPVKVTGAHLGLALHPLYGGGQALVPAWLFDVAGTSEPLAAVAVRPEYLAPPARPSASTGPVPDQKPPAPGVVTPESAAASPATR